MSWIADAAFYVHRLTRDLAIHPGTPRERLQSVAQRLVDANPFRGGTLFADPKSKGVVAARLYEEIRAVLAAPRGTDIGPGTLAEWHVMSMSDSAVVDTMRKLFRIDWCMFYPEDEFDGFEGYDA